jgi:hypothetical protein
VEDLPQGSNPAGFRAKDNTHRPGTRSAALRDFNPPFVRFGLKADIQDCPWGRFNPRKRTSDLSDLRVHPPLVRAGDGPQERLEAIHVVTDVRVEVA